METRVYTGQHTMLPPLELVWINGSGNLRGKRFAVSPGQQTYGRDASNNIALDCPTISKNHGIILYQKKGQVVIYDTLSRNGISKRGKKDVLITLKVGQQVQIGSAAFKLVSENDTFTSQPTHGYLLASIGLLVIACLGTGLGFHFLKQPSLPTIPKSLPALESQPLLTPQAVPQPQATERITSIRVIKKNLQKITKTEKTYPTDSPQNLTKDLPKELPKTLESKAHEAFANGQFEQASTLWQRILTQDPSNQKAQEGLKSIDQIANLASNTHGDF